MSVPDFARHLAQALAAGADPAWEARRAALCPGIATTAHFPFQMSPGAIHPLATSTGLHTVAARCPQDHAGAAHARRRAEAPPASFARDGGTRVRPAAAPSRLLTKAQTQALEAMNALGAGLPLTFTRAELRSAYRHLARRFHPDRHAHRAANLAPLAATFARVTALYRVLAAA